MKIYISIPITGHNTDKVREHADAVKTMLSKAGHTPVNPFDIPTGKKNPEYIDYLLADLRVLNDCDAIYMCSGWGNSKGCTVEHCFAKTYWKAIFYEEGLEESVYYFNR